jgi:hypothetical protein
MHQSLQHRHYFVKSHVGLSKDGVDFDLITPDSRAKVLECREPKPGGLSQALRSLGLHRAVPFQLEVLSPKGDKVLTLRRGWGLTRGQVRVLDDKGQEGWRFNHAVGRSSAHIDCVTPDGKTVCSIRGRWSGWDFKVERDDKLIARITKQWMGPGKELFSSAEQFMVAFEPDLPENDPARPAVLAAAMSLELVFKS